MKVILLILSFTAMASTFELTILHTNDIHCRFEEANKFGSRCTPAEAKRGVCFGGFARLVHQTRAIRKEKPNTIYLNAGDLFQGTAWYTVHKWRVISHFANLLNLTATSLGNHEFDDGVEGLVPFVDAANFPILAANIDAIHEPDLYGKIGKHVVVEIGGRKIGIIGYLTTETTFLSRSGKVEIFDEISAIKVEARWLKKRGVDILIAVGHAGFAKDVEIAEQVEDIDVVIGGHTNTFLWNGDVPSIELSQGKYPTMVQQSSTGRLVPVVQAFAYGKYLGALKVFFDEHGELVNVTGHPILMDKNIPEDPQTLEELIPWRKTLEQFETKPAGRTRVFLDGSCRLSECNLGNLMTDSYIHLFSKLPEMGKWSKVAVAVMNGGAIRASIDERGVNGSITYGDMLLVAPFSNTVDLIKLKGKTLRKMFEFSVSNYKEGEASGRFLQVSGIRVVYDLTKPIGQRVVNLKARCSQCRIPIYELVDDDKVYDVVASSYLVGGGDGYSMIPQEIIDHQISGVLDYDCFIEYLSESPPVTIGLEDRILFINHTETSTCLSNSAAHIRTQTLQPFILIGLLFNYFSINVSL